MSKTLSHNTLAVLERLCMAATGPSEDGWRDVNLTDVAATDIPQTVFEAALAKIQTAGLFITADLPRCRVRDTAFEVVPA